MPPTVAIAIVCKTPAAGKSKTRLSPPLRPDECAALSACFIRDLSQTIQSVAESAGATGYAVYTPRGTEAELRRLLPTAFRLLPQCEGGFGTRLQDAMAQLLGAGHAGAILVNSDSPTLPASVLRAAADAVLRNDNVVLSPAFDGGYTLIGMSQLHARLFEDIPWSTSAVHRLTLDRAAEIGLSVAAVPGWYDVDDEASFKILEGELFRDQKIAPLSGAGAPATRNFLRERHSLLARSS